MADPCWMAAQLMADCAQLAQEGLKVKPVPESSEVQVRVNPVPQPQRSVAWPGGDRVRPSLAPLEPQSEHQVASSDAVSGVPAPAPQISSPLRPTAVAETAQPPRLSLAAAVQDYAESLPLWPETRISRILEPSPGPSSLPMRPAAEAVLTAAAPRIEMPRPHSGSQLFQQRWAALRAGQLYTRIAPNSFMSQWQDAVAQPSYEQWRGLLAQEARAIQAGQGQNRLTVVVGDSLSLWLPSDLLSRDRFWLNQGISGDTTAGVLQRLHFFADTRPTTIHLMAGINDLKNGASDAEVVNNLKDITIRLKQQHPQARIVVHSILPTRWPRLSSDRIRHINRYIAYVAQQQGAEFLDLQSAFADAQGNLRPELTSDGLHLNPQGYRLWQQALTQI